MNDRIKRRRRVLRVREAEKKITEVRLAAAQRKVAELDAMAGRIDQLEADIIGRGEMCDGQALQNKASMQAMLDKARADLMKPREQSRQQCDLRSGEHIRASIRSEGASRLVEKSVRSAEVEKERRDDANRPHIFRNFLGLAS